MKVVSFKQDGSIKEVLDKAVKEMDSLQGVMIIGLKKDGTQGLMTSCMNGFEKAYLVQFVNAWMNDWFDIGE